MQGMSTSPAESDASPTPHPRKRCPPWDASPPPGPSKSLLFPLCRSPAKGRRKLVQSMPRLARSYGARSSRHGIFHHLRLFKLEAQTSFFRGTESLAGATHQHCAVERKGAPAEADPLALQFSSSPESSGFFSVVVTSLAFTADKRNCSNIFLTLHLISCTLPWLSGTRQC